MFICAVTCLDGCMLFDVSLVDCLFVFLSFSFCWYFWIVCWLLLSAGLLYNVGFCDMVWFERDLLVVSDAGCVVCGLFLFAWLRDLTLVSYYGCLFGWCFWCLCLILFVIICYVISCGCLVFDCCLVVWVWLMVAGIDCLICLVGD